MICYMLGTGDWGGSLEDWVAFESLVLGAPAVEVVTCDDAAVYE
jgi:hypothetical protein